MAPSSSLFRRLLGSLTATPSAAHASDKRAAPTSLGVEALEERSLMSATAFTPQTVILPAGQSASPNAGTGPGGGYAPGQIQTAYGFNQISFLTSSTNAGYYNQNAGKGETIAIVDAYNDPTIISDANAFSSYFNLPKFNNTGGPTLKVVNQSGGSTLPSTDTGWATEIALDVEWAHAIAPQANIVLVEANSSYLSDLFSAVNYAASQAPVVSMSWGGGEFSSETSSSYDGVFSGHSHVTFVAASGDYGAGVSYPAVSPNVLAVGGTSLSLTSTNQWSSEKGWGNGSYSWYYGGSGGGYASYESEPSYQKLSYPHYASANGYRMSPDVAYDANPNTGFSVYDSTGMGGWGVVGGTSAGAPQWAALVALADQGRGSAGALGSSQVLNALYTMAGSKSSTGASLYGTYFHDITSGNTGYSAGTGYDLVTGLGSPKANNIVSYLVSHVNSSTATPALTTGPAATSSTTPAASLRPSALEPAGDTPVASLAAEEEAAALQAQQQAPDTHLLLGLLAQLDEANSSLLTRWLQDTDSYRLALSALVAHKETPLG